MNPSLLLRGGPSGPTFGPSTPGYVLTIQADGKSVAAAPGSSGGVTSWNGRTGVVIPVAGDYDASQVSNDSSVPGASVKDALDTLYSAPPGGVTSWNSRAGTVLPVAGDYAASGITNDSLVAGAFVDDALNTLAGGIGALSIATTAPLAGGGLLSSGLTLTVADVSNASKGVAPAITTANGALLANGAGTSSAWALIANANVATGAAIAIAKLEVGPANTFLAGTGAGNVWTALATAPSNPSDNGKVYVASAGDASFLGGSSQGQALLWNTSTGWTPGTDFAAQNLTTTGYLYLQGGGAPATPALPTTGNLRISANWTWVGKSNNGSVDVPLMAYGTTSTGNDVFALGGQTSGVGPGLTINTASGILFNFPAGSSMAFGQSQILFGSVLSNLVFGVASMSIRAATGTSPGGTGGAIVVNGGDNSGAGSTGGAVTYRGGDASGTGATTGGAALFRPGLGATEGVLSVQSGGGVNRLRVNGTGLGFYTAAPVAQAARAGQLTDSTTGAASTTLVDVGAVPTQANINNNFASIAAKYNALELAIHNIGVTA